MEGKRHFERAGSHLKLTAAKVSCGPCRMRPFGATSEGTMQAGSSRGQGSRPDPAALKMLVPSHDSVTPLPATALFMTVT